MNLVCTTYPSGFTNGTTKNSRLSSREVTCTKTETAVLISTQGWGLLIHKFI